MPRAYGLALLLFLLCSLSLADTLTGRIVDAKSGEPVAKAEVIATGHGQRTRTDSNASALGKNRPFALTKSDPH